MPRRGRGRACSGPARPGGQRRSTLANGRGAAFAEGEALARQEFIVAVDLDDREREARILLAAPLPRAQLLEYCAERVQNAAEVVWDSREQAVLARQVLKLDALTLEDKPLPEVPAEAARAAMLAGVRELGI